MKSHVAPFLAAVLLCSFATLLPHAAVAPANLEASSSSSARSHASQRPRHGFREVVGTFPGAEEEGGYARDDGDPRAGTICDFVANKC